MPENNLLIITNNFPNQDNSYIADIFVKEQLNYLKVYFDNVYVISPVAYGIEQLRKTIHKDYQYDNIKVFFPKYFNFPFCYSRFRNIWLILEANALKNFIKKKKISFDLIHAHFTWPSGAVAIPLKREFKVPVVITEHTHLTLYKELKNKDRHYLTTWNNCDAIIRVKKMDIPLFIRAGIPGKKIFYVTNGYDPKKYFPISMTDARNVVKIGLEKRIILNISRLFEEKGQKYLIEAMASVVKKNPEIICYIGGSGPLKNKLQKQINYLNLEKNVMLIGLIPDNLMSLWMNACDLFIFPSLSESFGIVQLEALACGKPVIATKNGGSEEVIIPNEQGFIVEPANPEELAEKILLALDQDWDGRKILTYAERFTWERIAKDIIDVYLHVLKQGSNSFSLLNHYPK
jgi:teichuronic acid biosynthesis glycosyltransferase TuaC